MEADKRREQRRQRARERVNRRLEDGGDAAIEEIDAEYRAREMERQERPEPATDFGRTRRSRKRPSTASVGRTLDPAELLTWHEERDAALATSARQKAAIVGLVPFDHDVYVERRGSGDAEEPDRCTFGQCPRRPKWMAPERAEGTDWYLTAVCNEHVAPPS